MSVFLTGATGYIGSYIATGLLRDHPKERLHLLVRAKNDAEAKERIWKSLQLHMGFEEFNDFVSTRVDFSLGDLTSSNLGLSAEGRDRLVKSTTSVIHCAASLNRKSSKACFNVNLRGTLEILKIARAAQDHHGLRRFSDISTVAVCGLRQDEVVTEENIIDWDKSDYDPYARTKKFCEHMVHELLPDVDTKVFRPSIVLGDSRFPETQQFDMVRAFVFLAQLPFLPFKPDWRIDIVPADYVGRSVVHVHQLEKPKYESYNLSSGEGSLTYQQVIDALSKNLGRKPMFMPKLEKTFGKTVDMLADSPRKWGVAGAASLMKVFMPYLTFNTVFSNKHIVEEMKESPVPFDRYAYPLFEFATKGKFTYPFKPYPGAAAASSHAAAA